MTRVAPSGSEIRAPVIILGAPRSGTTLLADLLGAHPDVVVIQEPRLVWRYGNDRLSDQLRAEHARPEVIAHIHDSFAATIDRHGATMVEKTPANSVRPHFVDAIFPDARYVHITRNGWSAVPSIRDFSVRRGSGLDRRQLKKVGRRLREAELGQVAHYLPELVRRLSGPLDRGPSIYGPRLAGLSSVARELGQLETAALQWRTCVDSAGVFGRQLPGERYLEIQLERLGEDALHRVLDHCGLPVAPEVVERFRSTYRPEAGQRRATITDAERAVIASYVVPANAQLGYPEPSVGSAPAGPR